MARKKQSKKPTPKASKSNHQATMSLQVKNAGKAQEADVDSDSPFLRFPREVRDLVYEELFIARMTPEDQEKYDKVKAAKDTPYDDYGRANALDYFEQNICIMPGAAERYRFKFISEASGLLRTNKQINEEANEVLFGKNTFVIMPEHEREHSFWRCESPRCFPSESPCYVFFPNFKKIKHIYIIIYHTRALDDPLREKEASNLEKNIKNMVRCILEGRLKLHTLRIRYTSLFEGQVEAVRANLEGKPIAGKTNNPTMLRDCHGRNHYVKHGEASQKVFRHGTILEGLRGLKGISDDVRIRGDLPQAYMDELQAMLTSSHRSKAIKKMQEAREAESRARQEAEKDTGFHACIRRILEKNGGDDPGGMLAQCLKTSVKPPTVMAELMKEPSKESLDAWRRSQAPRESNNSGVHGGIGMTDGKPVYGPARPPSGMDI